MKSEAPFLTAVLALYRQIAAFPPESESIKTYLAYVQLYLVANVLRRPPSHHTLHFVQLLSVTFSCWSLLARNFRGPALAF